MKCSGVNPSDEALSVTSTTLLRGARARDSEAWQELVRRYSRRMYRWCRIAGLQPADSANVVQEAFVALNRKLPTFRRDRAGDTFRGWLRRITDNKIRDHYRSLGKRVDQAAGGTDAQEFLLDTAWAADWSAQDLGEPDAIEPAGATEILDAITRIRGEVSERNWRMFWRVAVDGQSAVDVGLEFGVSANAVRIVKMRVLRRLRGQLEELPDRPLSNE